MCDRRFAMVWWNIRGYVEDQLLKVASIRLGLLGHFIAYAIYKPIRDCVMEDSRLCNGLETKNGHQEGCIAWPYNSISSGYFLIMFNALLISLSFG